VGRLVAADSSAHSRLGRSHDRSFLTLVFKAIFTTQLVVVVSVNRHLECAAPRSSGWSPTSGSDFWRSPALQARLGCRLTGICPPRHRVLFGGVLLYSAMVSIGAPAARVHIYLTSRGSARMDSSYPTETGTRAIACMPSPWIQLAWLAASSQDSWNWRGALKVVAWTSHAHSFKVSTATTLMIGVTAAAGAGVVLVRIH